jgi:uncharacterized protein
VCNGPIPAVRKTGDVSFADGELNADLGYVAGKAPREAAFKRALDEELERMQKFLLPKN